MSSTETLWCEQCGEREGAFSFASALYCDECAEEYFQEMLSDALGYRPCGTLVTQGNGELSVCIARAGLEHDHGAPPREVAPCS
jgi:hypothetical protein